MKKALLLLLIFGFSAPPLSLQCHATGSPKLLVEEDPALLTTVVNVVVLSGAADDSPNKSGLANMLGELMLRGTKKRSRSKFQNEVERLGASLSVHTYHDAIIFEGRVIKENTDAFLKLLEDALLHPAFSAGEFKSLKTEILAEISNRKNQNSRLAGMTLRKRMFANTPMERSADGSLTTVESLTLDDLQKSYNDRLHQGNILFAVATPFKEKQIGAELKTIWDQLPDGLRVTRHSIQPQVPSSPEILLVEKPHTATGAMMMGQAGIVAQDPERFALGVGNFSFGGEAQLSRLYQVIRGELGWTYAIGSSYNAMGDLTSQQGIYIISSTPSVEFTVKTMLKSLSMWKDYFEGGLKKEEILAARDSLVNSYPFEFDSAEKRLARRLHSYLYNVPILSPEEFEKTLKSINNDGIVKALKDRAKQNGWIIVVVADKKELEKQLDAEQKEVPPSDRFKITKVFTPEEVIR